MPDREKVINDLMYLRSYARAAQEPMLYEPIEGALVLLRGQTGQWIWDRPHHFRCSGCGGVVGQRTYLYCPNCGREMFLSETEQRKEWPEEVSGDA